MNTTPEYCHFTEEQIRESKLLSPERFLEVVAAIESRILPVFGPGGKEIPLAKLANMGEGKGLLFARLDTENSIEYMRRTILSSVLTESELATINRHCLDAAELHRNEERFAKAEKLDSWDGGVFWGDDYFSTMDECCDRIVCDGDDWPKYVWAAQGTTVIPALDAADVVGHIIDDRGWEDMDIHDLNGVPELDEALKKFTEANAGVISYTPDYSKAILTTAWKAAQTGD